MAEQRGTRERRAVLVLPDVGLKEERVKALQDDFQNAIIGTLKRGGAELQFIIIIVVVVVVFSG